MTNVENNEKQWWTHDFNVGVLKKYLGYTNVNTCDIVFLNIGGVCGCEIL